MLWDTQTRSLLILSGQRNKDYLSDFYSLAVDSNSVTWLQKNLQFVGGPEGAFTQRACLDPVSREMFVFSGLMRDSAADRSEGNHQLQGILYLYTHSLTRARAHFPFWIEAALKASGDFWCFDLESRKWSRILTATAAVGGKFCEF